MTRTGRDLQSERERRRRRITEAPITPTLLWLAGPIMLSQFVNISYALVDAILLGRLGKAEFGAPTVTWPLVFFFFSIGMGFSQAGISVVSQLYGAKRYGEAEKAARDLLGIMLALSLLLSILPYALAPLILNLMGVPGDVMPHALSYIRIILLGLPFALLYMTFVTISNALGDTRTPMKLSITAALINIALDPLLIFGLLGFPRLEVMGAAIATTVARVIVSIAALYILASGKLGLRILPRPPTGERTEHLRTILRIGPYLALQRSANSLGFVVMASIVAHFGSTAIAAYGVALRLIDILQAFNMSLSRATEIMVGQNIGARKKQRAREIVYKAMGLMAAVMVVGAIILYTLAPHVVGLFIDDPEVVSEGSRLIRILVPSLPFFGLFFIANAASTGSGRVRLFTLIGLMRLWVFRIGLGILLAYQLNWGVDGIWASISLSNIITGILAVVWTLTTKWYIGIIKEPGAKAGGEAQHDSQEPTTASSKPDASEASPTRSTRR